MRVIVVIVQLLPVVEVLIAETAERVAGALNVVLAQAVRGREVLVAWITDVMAAGCILMLLEGTLRVEPAITANAFRHLCVSREEEEGGGRGQRQAACQ